MPNRDQLLAPLVAAVCVTPLLAAATPADPAVPSIGRSDAPLTVAQGMRGGSGPARGGGSRPGGALSPGKGGGQGCRHRPGPGARRTRLRARTGRVRLRQRTRTGPRRSRSGSRGRSRNGLRLLRRLRQAPRVRYWLPRLWPRWSRLRSRSQGSELRPRLSGVRSRFQSRRLAEHLGPSPLVRPQSAGWRRTGFRSPPVPQARCAFCADP